MIRPSTNDMKWCATTFEVRADDSEWDTWLAEYTRQQREEAWDEGYETGANDQASYQGEES